MNTMLALPRVRGPGFGWLPAVWRRADTRRTVMRFVVFGPLIGGLPYNVFLLPIPFSYVIGGLPALLAGLLFATWYHAGPPPGPAWRGLLGALCGAAAALASVAVFVLASDRPSVFVPAVIAVHGIPAATILALATRSRRPRA